MRIYIAGPMRGHPEYNFPAFHDAARRWRLKGHEVISPAEMDQVHGFDEKKDAVDNAFLRAVIVRDMEAIAKCDGIVMLADWENSSGAKLERALADYLGLEVFDDATQG